MSLLPCLPRARTDHGHNQTLRSGFSHDPTSRWFWGTPSTPSKPVGQCSSCFWSFSCEYRRSLTGNPFIVVLFSFFTHLCISVILLHTLFIKYSKEEKVSHFQVRRLYHKYMTLCYAIINKMVFLMFAFYLCVCFLLHALLIIQQWSLHPN